MTDSSTDQTEQTQSSSGSNRPELVGYTVTDRGDDKRAIWTRIAAAWPHKDGGGYDLRFQALPIDGRLTLRFEEQPDASDGSGQTHEEPAPV